MHCKYMLKSAALISLFSLAIIAAPLKAQAQGQPTNTEQLWKQLVNTANENMVEPYFVARLKDGAGGTTIINKYEIDGETCTVIVVRFLENPSIECK